MSKKISIKDLVNLIDRHCWDYEQLNFDTEAGVRLLHKLDLLNDSRIDLEDVPADSGSQKSALSQIVHIASNQGSVLAMEIETILNNLEIADEYVQQ